MHLRLHIIHIEYSKAYERDDVNNALSFTPLAS